MEMRICSTCGKEKEDKSFKSKYGTKCFTCIHKAFKNKNPEAYRLARKQEYLANRAAIIQRKKETAESSFINFLRHCLRKPLALRTGKEYDLDIEYIMDILHRQNEYCAISGIKLTHKRNDLRAVSIDRIDSSKGYIRGNIQLVCQFINMGKREKSNEECLSIIREIETNALKRL